MADIGTVYPSPFPDSYDVSAPYNGFTLVPSEAMEIRPGWGNVSRTNAVLHNEQTLRRTVNGSVLGWYDAVYSNALVLPSGISVGTIAAPVDGEFVIWNSSCFTRKFSITRTNWAGIDDDLSSSTITLGPLEDHIVRYTVTLNGPMHINAAMTVSDTSVSMSFGISGIRGIIWPFQPLDGMKETWAWKTEIQTAWDYSENRLALRDVPRVSYAMSYRLHGAAASQMDLLLCEMPHYTISLGLFEQSDRVTTSLAAGAEAIPCEQSCYSWKPGDAGLIWHSPRKAELFTVTGVSASALQLESGLSRDYSGAVIMPAVPASISKSERTDFSMDYSEFSVEFRLDAHALWWEIPAAGEQYDGTDIWNIPLYASKDAAVRNMSCEQITIDNGLGPIRERHQQEVPASSWRVTAYADTLEEINSLRGNLLRRQGCIVPFWTSTHRFDIVPAATIFTASNELTVKGFGSGKGFSGKSRRRFIRIEMADGTVFYRTITASVRNDDDTDTLALSEPLSRTEDIPKDAVLKISYMTLVRLASDVIKWTWHKTGRAEAAFSVTEVDG